MSNTFNNFTFLDFSYPLVQPSMNQAYSWSNCQPISFLPYFWSDNNLTAQISPFFSPYQLVNCINHQTNGLDLTKPFAYPCTLESNQIQIQSNSNEFHFSLNNRKQPNQSLQNAYISKGAFPYCTESQKKANQMHEENGKNRQNFGENINNSGLQLQNDDKKLNQNLRYQRKNIEANIVNKIYTYLKTSLKSGFISNQNKVIDKDKSLSCFRILEKLEKVKKQTIKRQFLKGLLLMDESLPGFSKISKQLQKKGQTIQQFEYYIRVIIRNYLRLNARNSILTSKKMNPSLWIDHLRKLRELEFYLFFNEQKQNQK